MIDCKNSTSKLHIKLRKNIFNILLVSCLLCISVSSSSISWSAKSLSASACDQSASSQNLLQSSNDTLKSDTTRQDTVPQTASDTLSSGESSKKGSDNFLDSKVEYNAKDSIVMSRDQNKIYLYGEAKIVYGNIELTADYIEYSQDSNLVYATGVKDSTGQMTGLPVFKEGGKTYDSRIIRYNFKTKKGYIRKVITEEEGGYLHSEVTKKHQNREFHFKNGKYTTCDKEHPHFYIRMTKGKVIPGEKIIAGPSHMVLADIPLFPIAIPFGYFPIQKRQASGILMPSFGKDNARGFYLREGGYYWGINDYMDLTLRGEVYTKGTWGMNLQYRLRKRYKYTSNFNFDYNRLLIGERGDPDFRASRDYRIQWTHQQDPKANPYSNFNASVNFSSTSYDRNFSRNMEDFTTNTKTSNISYSKRWPGSPFSFTGKLRHSQNSQTKMVNMTLPEMSFDMTRQYPLRKLNKSGTSKWYDDLQVSYSADLKNTYESPDSLLFKDVQFSDFESGFQHSLPMSLNFKVLKYLNISPQVQYSGVLYPRYIEKYWDPNVLNPEDSTYGRVVTDTIEEFRYAHSAEPSINLNISPKFFGMYQFKGEDPKVKAIRHVLTPRVGFSFRPSLGAMTSRYYDEYQMDSSGRTSEYSYFDNQIYRPPSAPRKSGNVTLGLSNNVEMKVRSDRDTSEKVRKIALLKDLSFSTSYDIYRDSMNWNPIRITGRTSMFDNKVNLSFSGSYDPYAINDNGQRINVSQWQRNGRPGRLTNFSLSLNTNLGPSQNKSSSEQQNGAANQGIMPSRNPYDYFDVPWSLSFGYRFNYSKPKFKSSFQQTVNVRGNFSLTDKWKFNFTANYDIKEDKLAATRIGITRDLHCWTMSFDWVPVGYRKSYNFEIRVVKSILSDLKYTKRKSWAENL